MARLVLKKSVKPILIILVSFVVLLISLSVTYLYLSSPIDKKSDVDVEVMIKKGMKTEKIASTLKNDRLIKSKILFMIKTKLSGRTLKASTYLLKRSMSLNEIVDIMTDGNKYNADIVKLTFKEGKSITEFARLIDAETDNSYDEVIEVIKDKNYLHELVNKYSFLTEDILNSDIYYPLEGYLSPNTYEFSDKKVTIKKIIETMLNETESEYKEYKDKMDLSKQSIHDYFTLASILELEGTNTKDRQMIAGVFENRLNANMNLGSDVTTYYGLQKNMREDLTVADINSVNPYNTRLSTMRGMLPPGAVCNPSTSSLEAAVNPTENEYLFFVADKTGKIYYSKTNQEHEKVIAEIKEAGNWIW